MKTDVIVDPSFKPIVVETANTLGILLPAHMCPTQIIEHSGTVSQQS